MRFNNVTFVLRKYDLWGGRTGDWHKKHLQKKTIRVCCCHEFRPPLIIQPAKVFSHLAFPPVSIWLVVMMWEAAGQSLPCLWPAGGTPLSFNPTDTFRGRVWFTSFPFSRGSVGGWLAPSPQRFSCSPTQTTALYHSEERLVFLTPVVVFVLFFRRELRGCWLKLVVMWPTETGKERRKTAVGKLLVVFCFIKSFTTWQKYDYGKITKEKQTIQKKHVLDASGSDTLTKTVQPCWWNVWVGEMSTATLTLFRIRALS